MRRIILALLAPALAAGCTIELSPRHVPRLVNSGLATRHTSPGYVMSARQMTAPGGEGSSVSYTVSKGLGMNYRYEFEGGFSAWTTPDGFVMVDRKAGRAEVVLGITEPATEDLRVALTWVAKRGLSRNRVLAQTGTRECGRKGYRLISTPRIDAPLLARTEAFFDKETRAILLMKTYGPGGEVDSCRRAESVRPLGEGEYRVPEIPPGARAVRLSAAPGKEKPPGWAPAPKRALAVLCEPRGGFADGTAAFDLSRGGHVFVLFARRSEGEMLLSPVASTVPVNGADVHVWRVGGGMVFRWELGGVVRTVVTTLPADLVHGFLAANIPAAGAEVAEDR